MSPPETAKLLGRRLQRGEGLACCCRHRPRPRAPHPTNSNAKLAPSAPPPHSLRTNSSPTPNPRKNTHYRRAVVHPRPLPFPPPMASPFETLLAQESFMASPVYDKAGTLYVTRLKTPNPITPTSKQSLKSLSRFVTSPETGEVIKIDITGDAGNIRASPSTFGTQNPLA